ncbi:MAG: hypothetical protein AAFQ63_06670 [Cyanobacteria bacterium J06621_11]
MSIEQTNQLILLILNSVLMTLLTSVLLGGAWLRQHSLFKQLNQVRSHYYRLTHINNAKKTISQSPDALELRKIREHRQQLIYQYHWSRAGLISLHAAVLVFGVSLFALALRSLLPFDQLISSALFLFVLGAAGLLIGTGCLLIDFAQGNSRGESLGCTLAQVMQQLTQQWFVPKVREVSRLGDQKIEG